MVAVVGVTPHALNNIKQAVYNDAVNVCDEGYNSKVMNNLCDHDTVSVY